MVKTVLNASPSIRSMIVCEDAFASTVCSLRFSKASGLSGFAQRQLISRVVAVASCVFSFALLFPKLAVGLWDAGTGCISSIKKRK